MVTEGLVVLHHPLDPIKIDGSLERSLAGSKSVAHRRVRIAEAPTRFGSIDPLPIVDVSDPDSGRCLLYTSPSPRDGLLSRMPSSA